MKKQKCLNMGPKIPDFETGIWKQCCHIWNQHPRICLTAKFGRKTKIPKFGIRNTLFGCFWVRILKNSCHIWNKHFQICRKWVFNSYSEFWYRVAFSKGPGSAFSEGPSPGPGPLYKVCLLKCFLQFTCFQWLK